MQYNFDTNIIISAFLGDKEAISLLEKTNESYSITPIVAAELFKGAYLRNDKDKTEKIMKFVSDAGLLPFSIEACRIFGEKYAKLKKQGKLTQDLDLFIASISIAHNSTLVTKNKKHFENIKGLDVVYV